MEVTLECNSKERFKRGKDLVEEAGGIALQHVRDEFKSQTELKRSALAHGKRDDELPRPSTAEERKLIASYLDDHYRRWLDMTLPALDGKTPRDAAKTSKGRAQLIELLKEFENNEERKRRNGEPFYDVNKLRKELKLTP